MTDHSTQYNTVTVPVGFGGKSNPYVPDPAPTLLVELASVDRAKEEQKVAALLEEAEATAASVSAAAESAAAALRTEAEESASSLIASSRDEAAALLAAAEEEALAIRRAADESVADTLSNIEIRQAELDERAAALESLQSELEERREHLTQRLAAVDAEVAEAADVVSSAHTEADSVLAAARSAAEEILESARQRAEDEARAIVAEARTAAAYDSALEERIADIESVHRIEVQVLHDREVELLERIATLEAQARAAAPPRTDGSEGTDDEANDASRAAPAEPLTDFPARKNGRTPGREDDESVAIDLDGEHADVTGHKDSRMNGRHASEGGHATDRSPGPGPIVTHAPLTEQLSTSAFRAPENDPERSEASLMDASTAKEQAEALVRVAESLVTKARDEAASIVSDGQRRVSGILADADALRAAAERDAASTRSEAEQRLADARRQADALLEEAREAREKAIESARDGLDASRAAAASAPPGTSTPGATSEYAVQEASEVADRILRVARSEAEARSRAVTEEARRRAEIIERDARGRAEVAAQEYRDLVRNMQAAELSAKARIRELDTEIARLERLLNRVTDEAERRGIDVDPAADPVEPREVSASGIIFPTTVSSQPPVPAPAPAPKRPPVVSMPSDEESGRTAEPVPVVTRPRPIDRLASPPGHSEDAAAEKARRGIRRRA